MTFARIVTSALVATLLMAACRRSNPEAAALLARADSLLNPPPSTAASQTPPAGGPQGALHLLDSVQHQARTAWPKADRMRYEVLLAEAMNKSYKPFTTDSVLKQVVRYYDRHGSNDEQLKAHYLLGCAYRDMGEAPAAINAWQEAVDCADTLSADCDYNTLYRVYGQMAEIYRNQGLFEKQLKAEDYSCRFAILTGDSTNYINALQLKIGALYNVGDISNVYKVTEEVRRLYLMQNDRKRAARVYSTMIRIAIERGQYIQADSIISIYEHESGLFDSIGNILHPHEQYHYYKGLYYAGANQLDSAEFQFRKLLPIDGHQIEAYHGLFAVFQQKGLPDSLFKYGQLYERELAVHKQMTKTNAVIQADNMYDYERHQQEANRKTIESRKLAYAVLILFILALVMSMFIFFFKHKKDEKQDEFVQVENKYHNTIVELEKAKALSKEMKRKRAEDRKKQIEKDTKIEHLTEIVTDLKQKLNEPSRESQVLEMKVDEITQYFRVLAHPHPANKNGNIVSARAANAEEWDNMIKIVKTCYTPFYFSISSKNLTKREFRVCILSRLQFSVADIATLTGTSEENATNIRRLVSKKLFGINSAIELNEKLMGL